MLLLIVRAVDIFHAWLLLLFLPWRSNPVLMRMENLRQCGWKKEVVMARGGEERGEGTFCYPPSLTLPSNFPTRQKVLITVVNNIFTNRETVKLRTVQLIHARYNVWSGLLSELLWPLLPASLPTCVTYHPIQEGHDKKISWYLCMFQEYYQSDSFLNTFLFHFDTQGINEYVLCHCGNYCLRCKSACAHGRVDHGGEGSQSTLGRTVCCCFASDNNKRKKKKRTFLCE